MTAPSLPNGYDVSKPVQAGRRDCQITVGFDRPGTKIPRFLVQLHYIVSTNPVQWEAIARMDHNETSITGHNVYRQGLHVDVDRRTSPEVKLRLSHGPLPQSCGSVIRGCTDYFRREADYFINVYEERQSPGAPPKWPDGGKRTPTFISSNTVGEDMEGGPTEDPLSSKELTELLAKAEDTTPEEIDRQAEELEIAPPEEATVVDED